MSRPKKLTKAEVEFLEGLLEEALGAQSCETNDAADKLWTKLVAMGVLPEGQHDPVA